MKSQNTLKSWLPPEAVAVGGKLFQVPEDPNLSKENRFSFISKSKSDIKVVGLAADTTACGHYRIKYPLMNLARLGVSVRVEKVAGLAELDFHILRGATHIIMSRCVNASLFAALRAYSDETDAVLIFDLDDCFNEISPNNPVYPFYDPDTEFGQKNRHIIANNLEQSDGVLFSTRELKGYYDDLISDSQILHNGLDLSLGTRSWMPADRAQRNELAAAQNCNVDDDTVVVGWMGSPTHIDDLDPLGEAIKQILRSNPNALLAIYGHVETAMHCCMTRWHLPPDRYFFVPPTSFEHYPAKIGWFDIGLAPLANTAFNRCKSDLRLMEMGAMGVPYVASKVAPYYRFHLQTRGMGGFIAADTKDWVEHVSTLIRKPEERALRGTTLQKYVYEHCDVSHTAASLLYTLRTITNNKQRHMKSPDATMLKDMYYGIPYPQKTYLPLDPCPCGSGDSYGSCWRNCSPAWG